MKMNKYFILLTLVFAGFTANAQERARQRADMNETERMMGGSTGSEASMQAVPMDYNSSMALLYATDHLDNGFYATTVGQPSGAHHKIGTISVSYQAMEMVNGILYVVTYDETDGITFGVYNYKTGVFTQIAKGGAVPDAISMAWNPLDNEVYVTQWSDDASGSFGKINLTTGAFTALGAVPGNFYITIDNDGVCYGVGEKGSSNSSVFGTINLTNGNFTQIATGDPMNWIQDMSVDRSTNEIYHIHRGSVAGVPRPNTFRKMNKTNGTYTFMGAFDKNVESFVIFDSCTPVKTFPWTEGFEGVESSYMPSCWTEEVREWTVGWRFVKKSDFDEPYTAHGGSYKAYYSGPEGHTAKLITPPMDLSGLTAPALNFWHAQKKLFSRFDHDQLKVYYKTSAAGKWNLLAEYKNEIPDWTERTVALPNASADYYIAFEAIGYSGHGVHLDDVKIFDNPGGAGYEITGSDELPPANPLRARVIDGLLHVSGVIAGETMSIYNAAGALVYNSIATSDEMDIPLNTQGVYIVRSGENTVRVSIGN